MHCGVTPFPQATTLSGFSLLSFILLPKAQNKRITATIPHANPTNLIGALEHQIRKH